MNNSLMGNGGKRMKLFDYMKLVPDGEEITVFDKEYDVETYFYGGYDTG